MEVLSLQGKKNKPKQQHTHKIKNKTKKLSVTKNTTTRHVVIYLKLLLSVDFLINREKLGKKSGGQHP